MEVWDDRAAAFNDGESPYCLAYRLCRASFAGFDSGRALLAGGVNPSWLRLMEDSYQLDCNNSEPKLAAVNEANEALRAELQQNTKKSCGEETAAAIAELLRKHEAEIAGMVTKQQHDETIHALQACHAYAHALVYLCPQSFAHVLVRSYIRAGRRRRLGGGKKGRLHAGVWQADLQAQKQKVNRGMVLLTTMQQLEAQLESCEQKLKSANEAAEQSEVKLAAANKANEALQAELQSQKLKLTQAEARIVALEGKPLDEGDEVHL